MHGKTMHHYSFFDVRDENGDGRMVAKGIDNPQAQRPMTALIKYSSFGFI